MGYLSINELMKYQKEGKLIVYRGHFDKDYTKRKENISSTGYLHFAQKRSEAELYSKRQGKLGYISKFEFNGKYLDLSDKKLSQDVQEYFFGENKKKNLSQLDKSEIRGILLSYEFDLIPKYTANLKLLETKDMAKKQAIINKVITKLAKKKVKDLVPGGIGDGRPDSDFDPKQLAEGVKIEVEHTKDKDLAKEIAKDHLTELPNYYINDKGESRLKVMEQEAELEIEKSK